MKPDALPVWRRRLFLTAGAATLAGVAADSAATPVWGARESSPADTLPEALQPGQWIWLAAETGGGPLLMLVSLTEQRAYLYRNGVRVAISTVSTGKPGHETPTGVFTVLQKDKNHHSSLYNNAPMPYQQRLTWDGVALHAGGLPGYPESHGCVHLPSEFARRLFAITHLGMTVVVARQGVSPTSAVHPGPLAPVRSDGSAPLDPPRLSEGEAWRWTPEAAPGDGPLALVLSLSDLRLVVLRQGLEIGRSRIVLRQGAPAPGWGTHAYVMGEGTLPGEVAGYPVGQAPAWFGLALPGQEAEAGQPLDRTALERVSLPSGFLAALLPGLRPGSVLVVTDQAILPSTTGPARRLIDDLPPH
ncbi:MAG: L,D-transpeptidase [Burkholderiales bacterium]|nr:L,D-transpeptidase [Burkholderiales bacterium]